MNKSDILNYKDYRAFLADYNSWRNETRTGWSLSTWTRHLGLAYPSALSMILNKKRHVGDKLLQTFCEYFEFNEAEKTHFTNLVKYEKSIESATLRVMVLNYLDGEKKNSLARYIVREGLRMPRFEDTESCLAEVLAPILGMKPQEVLNLEPGVPDKPDPKSMHQEVLGLLERSFDLIPKESRQYSTNFIRMKPERLQEAITKLRAFQREFIAEFDAEDGESLVCFQNAVFSMLKEEPKDKLPSAKLN
ncbi:TIGR02147 family protein [Bdellovibrio bacteriovorus]